MRRLGLLKIPSKIAFLSVLGLLGALFFPPSGVSQVSPFQGLGQVQFFDNSGAPLVSGVLYSYQAGTSTQQATYTDSTGTTQNVNPITFGSGARAQIWLTTAALYKFVLCAQNDGPFCAGGDILFTVDNVPGGATGGGGGGGGSPFTGIFISSTASPATSGILRLASGDTSCWRNAAGSANLCWSKDSNDLLSWAGGSFKLPEVGAPSGVPGFDLLWADNTAHRWMMVNNGASAAQFVASGVDINTSDQVTQWHFGSTVAPLNSTAPTSNQDLTWDGTNISGVARGSISAVDTQAGTTYTLALSDAGGWVRMTSDSANTVTVPLNATVAYPINTVISVRQSGTGQTTISPAGGVTINSTVSPILRTQNSTISLVKVGTDIWDLVGDLQ